MRWDRNRKKKRDYHSREPPTFPAGPWRARRAEESLKDLSRRVQDGDLQDEKEPESTSWPCWTRLKLLWKSLNRMVPGWRKSSTKIWLRKTRGIWKSPQWKTRVSGRSSLSRAMSWPGWQPLLPAGGGRTKVGSTTTCWSSIFQRVSWDGLEHSFDGFCNVTCLWNLKHF